MALLVLAGAVLVLPVQRPGGRGANEGVSTTSELLEGFRVLRREPAARLLVGLLGVAVRRDRACSTSSTSCSRSTRSAWAREAPGYLNAAFGAGGALGIGVTASLVGRARLMPRRGHVARRLGGRVRR